MSETFDKLIEAIEFGEEEDAAALAQQAINEGSDPSAIINEAMAEGVRRAGVRFNEGEFFLPELMLAGEAMKAGLEVVMPAIEASMTKLKTKGKIMMGSVEGDVHDIGKNICISMLQSQGYQVIDLGVDNEEDWIVEQVQKESPDILGLGSYMTTTMVHIPSTFERLRNEGLAENMKMLAGGAAINERWATDVAKADGYSEDAWGLIDLVNEMMGVEGDAGSLGYGRDSDRTKIV